MQIRRLYTEKLSVRIAKSFNYIIVIKIVITKLSVIQTTKSSDTMSWSTELWDQFDTISNHTAKGIEFLEKLGHFVRDRCSIEIDYAGKLRKLAKNYDQTKKRDEVLEFTYYKAFSQLLKEISDMAGQHEVVAENLSNQIVREISVISRDLKEERKRHLSEGLKYQNLLNMSLNQLDKSKKGYDKSFRESEKANENYKKADKDLNLSRAELEKAKTISLTKERACENSKTDYAKQLQVANQAQREHYTEFMPKVFQQLQDMENRRIECTKNFMKLSAIVQKNVMPIVNKCLDGVIDAANTINPNSDAQLVVDRYKSGMQPPDDIPFEDLSDKAGSCETESTQSKGSSLVYTHSLKSDSLRHTFTARGLRRRTKIFGIFGANKDDYSELPPNQRRKKIQAKIDQLNKEISQSNNEKDGLLVMKQAYEENGAFGDPKKIELQLRKNEQELDRLNKDLAKHLVLFDQLEELGFNKGIHNISNSQQQQGNNDNSNSIGATENESSKSPSITNSNHRASIGRESQLSRTNSDNSIRPDNSSGNNNNHNNCDGTKSSTTNRTSNSFADSLSDSVSNNANSVEVQ